MKLGRVSRQQLHQTFQEAFSDYAMDMSFVTEERLRIRYVKNGVDWDASVGAFDGDRMVGFTLIGIEGTVASDEIDVTAWANCKIKAL